MYTPYATVKYIHRIDHVPWIIYILLIYPDSVTILSRKKITKTFLMILLSKNNVIKIINLKFSLNSDNRKISAIYYSWVMVYGKKVIRNRLLYSKCTDPVFFLYCRNFHKILHNIWYWKYFVIGNQLVSKHKVSISHNTA